ncbi:MAG: sugar ABC transporter permease [Lachnospiraceae bacterium]|nr:sugar ABC transporter permease [Lachnospiraceae bacterium]
MKKKKSIFRKFLYSQKVAPYVFIAPFIITFLLFFAYSIVSMVIMSFQRVAGPNTTFNGLENYKILTNAVFIKSLKNSIFYTIVSCALMIPIPMVLAIMLNSKQMRLKTTFRSMLFIPALTSVVVVGVIFRLMFGELEGSFMNQLIAHFGMEPLIWLRKPGTVWLALFLICLWRWTGVNMMYYLSGLQQIPEDLYESATVDGANAFQQFRYVTLPLLKPTTVYVLTISIFGGMAMFSESFILFNGNKSPNNVGTTLVGMLYRMGFEQNQIGIASAIGVIFLVIVLLINAAQLIVNGFFKKEER